MEYRQLRRKQVDEWVKGLIAEKGGPKQVDLLEKTLRYPGAKYVAYIEKCIAQDGQSAYENPQAEVPSLLVDGTAKVFELIDQHMYLMPSADIVKLYRHWKDIPYEIAAMHTFWGSVTLRAISDGIIEPSWLVVGRKDTGVSARTRLDKAIQSERKKDKDGLVRRILRWMMGPGQMRGAPELYGNCSLAKAWWCGHIADDCSSDESLGLEIDEATRVLAEIWPGYSDFLAGRLTVAGLPSVYRGLALWASRETTGSKPTHDQIEKILKRLGEISSWCMLGLKSPSEVKELTKKIHISGNEASASAE